MAAAAKKKVKDEVGKLELESREREHVEYKCNLPTLPTCR